MFDRFTDRARQAVVLAHEEARLLGHDSIGPEHILLGVLSEGGGAAGGALQSLGITLDAARDQVAAVPGPPRGRPGPIPFTRRAKTALELALREAMQLGHEYIGTEHILLGLVHDDSDPAGQILRALGTDRAAVRRRVLERLPGGLPSKRPAGAARESQLRLRPDDETRALFETLDARLTAVEQWIGIAPGIAELDRELTRVRQGKEAAIDAHDYRTAEDLSETETELLVDRDRRVRGWAGQPSLAAEVAQLRAEMSLLRAELRAGRARGGGDRRSPAD